MYTHYNHNHNDINNNDTTNIYSNTQYKYRRTLLFQVRTVLLTSDFSSSTRGERHSSDYANHLQHVAHLVMFKISVGRDPKHPTTSSTAQIQILPQWQRTQLSATMAQSQLSTDSFSKFSNSQDHLFSA